MLVGGHVAQIVLAALGDEIGLGDDGDPDLDQVGDHVVGDDGRVFDAVARVTARRPQRGERDDQLGVGDTVQRHRDIVVVVIAHPADEFVDVEPIVVQDPLTRREEMQSLRNLAAPMRHRQRRDVVGGEIRCGVGDSGDSVARRAGG